MIEAENGTLMAYVGKFRGTFVMQGSQQSESQFHISAKITPLNIEAQDILTFGSECYETLSKHKIMLPI